MVGKKVEEAGSLGIKVSQKILLSKLKEALINFNSVKNERHSKVKLSKCAQKLTEEDLKVIIDSFFELIGDNLIKKGHVVEIKNFGKFYLHFHPRFKTYNVKFKLGLKTRNMLKEINIKYGGEDGTKWAKEFFNRE